MDQQNMNPLQGYAGSGFGEGRVEKDFGDIGSIGKGDDLKLIWNKGTRFEWKADCIAYIAIFDTRKPPSDSDDSAMEAEAALRLDNRSTYIKAVFEAAGITPLKVNVKKEADDFYKGVIVDSVEVKCAVTDLQKVKAASRIIDLAGLDCRF